VQDKQRQYKGEIRGSWPDSRISKGIEDGKLTVWFVHGGFAVEVEVTITNLKVITPDIDRRATLPAFYPIGAAESRHIELPPLRQYYIAQCVSVSEPTFRHGFQWNPDPKMLKMHMTDPLKIQIPNPPNTELQPVDDREDLYVTGIQVTHETPHLFDQTVCGQDCKIFNPYEGNRFADWGLMTTLDDMADELGDT